MSVVGAGESQFHVGIECDVCRAYCYLGTVPTLRNLELAIDALVEGSGEYAQRADLGAYVMAHSYGWMFDGRDRCPSCVALERTAPSVVVDNSMEGAL